MKAVVYKEPKNVEVEDVENLILKDQLMLL